MGDIFNLEDVDKAMTDQDVIISCLGKRLFDSGYNYFGFNKNFINVV